MMWWVTFRWKTTYGKGHAYAARRLEGPDVETIARMVQKDAPGPVFELNIHIMKVSKDELQTAKGL